jgi:hypothetical protein
MSDCTEDYRPVLSSERMPYMKEKESNCHTKTIKIWSWALKGLDTEKIWPTDHRSQNNLNLKGVFSQWSEFSELEVERLPLEAVTRRLMKTQQLYNT